MKITLRKSAIKNPATIDPQWRETINRKIDMLKEFPNVTNIKKLTRFEPAYRLRVGNYRILFDVFIDRIEVGRILHRKESYK